MPEACENCLGLVYSCIYYAHQAREIYQVLPYSVDFNAKGGLWNPPSKTACFILNKVPVNIWNDRKSPKATSMSNL